MSIGAVWVSGFDYIFQRLIKEELTDVGDVATREGTVGFLSTTLVCDDVNVGGTVGVVANKDGIEVSDAVGVNGSNTAKESLILNLGLEVNQDCHQLENIPSSSHRHHYRYRKRSLPNRHR